MTVVTSNAAPLDRLYSLLPVVHRQRDAELGHPLRDLLRVISEQVNLVEEDITRAYENWFIETCDDWVVPYIGDLVGYEVAHAVPVGDRAEEALRNKFLAPRRDVANFVRARRKRGTLALLELLAADSAALSARAVEFFTLLARSQSLNHLYPGRLAFADLRDMDALEKLETPFDRMAHTVDLRGVNAKRVPGRHNIPSAGAYLWRLRPYSVTRAPANFLQRGGAYYFYSFSVFGNKAPLFTKPVRETDPTTIAAEMNVPAPISRRALEQRPADFYGEGKSFVIQYDDRDTPEPVENIVAADLSTTRYQPPAGKIAVDPKLGRFAVSRDRDVGITVTYHYGFPGDTGAGEYARTVTQPRDSVIYRVGRDEQFATISDALDHAREEEHLHVVIEIADSGVYDEILDLEIKTGATLQIRAANRTRPVIRMIDRYVSRGEALRVTLEPKARFTLDGVVVLGRPVQIEGAGETPPAGTSVVFRRCTLVPGWKIDEDCCPQNDQEASIDVRNLTGRLVVDHTITGSVAVTNETAKAEPLRIDVRDSIVDATSKDFEAIFGPGPAYAWATLTIQRTTVIGQVFTHAIELGENSIFLGQIRVARRQIGCIRFCWVEPDRQTRTPRRYHCQPELAEGAARTHAAKFNAKHPELPQLDADDEAAMARLRVRPRFDSTRFGAPPYCRLAADCAGEIVRGADDESEVGVYHDLWIPQRLANLRARLDDSTPAGMETGIIYAD